MRATSGGKETMADTELNAMLDELERAVQDLLGRLARGTPGSAQAPGLATRRGSPDATPGAVVTADEPGRHH